ncbi:MAG: ABC transporter permease, partial [Planctomycetota bacterium]
MTEVSSAVGNILKRRKAAALSVLFLALLVGSAACAPWLGLHDPADVNLETRLSPPGGRNWLGTDHMGRDLLSRVIFGARISLGASAAVALAVMVLGAGLGMVAGFFGGWADGIIMRVVDGLLALPGMVLALAIAGTLGSSIWNLGIALVVVGWVGTARVVRGTVLTIKAAPYIEAARSLGCSNGRILLRHVLPGVLPPTLILLSLDMGGIILTFSAFSFLGLGIQPPAPEW